MSYFYSKQLRFQNQRSQKNKQKINVVLLGHEIAETDE